MGYLFFIGLWLFVNFFTIIALVYYIRRNKGNDYLSNIHRVFDKEVTLDDRTLFKSRLNLARIWGFVALFCSFPFLPLLGLGEGGLGLLFHSWFLGIYLAIGYTFYNSWKEDRVVKDPQTAKENV